MSNENNTILYEQLADLEQEAKDCEKSYLESKQTVRDEMEWLAKRELEYYKTKLELAEFKIALKKND